MKATARQLPLARKAPTLVLSLVAALALALAGPAAAQQSAADQYSGGGGVVNEVQAGGSGQASDDSNLGSLPFTGLDAIALLAGGFVLVGAGAGMSRVLARRPTA